MSVEIKTGNIFDSRADAIAIPVNLKGVMGAGLAKFFSLRYAHFVPLYRTAIERGYLRKNVSCLIRNNGDNFLMFPTKDDYREDSNLEDIEQTLLNLKDSWKKLKIKSVALPALGCGCGKLNYEDVKNLIEKIFEESELRVELYEPKQKFKSFREEAKDTLKAMLATTSMRDFLNESLSLDEETVKELDKWLFKEQDLGVASVNDNEDTFEEALNDFISKDSLETYKDRLMTTIL